MTNSNLGLVAQIEPEIVDKLVSSRRGLFMSAAASFGILATAPLVLAASAQQVFAKGGLPKNIIDVLNFALTLEYLEDGFYRNGLQQGVVPRKYHAVFRTISRHETAHVAFLKSALGGAASKAPKVDFTAGGKYADVFRNFDTFLTLSQTFLRG